MPYFKLQRNLGPNDFLSLGVGHQDPRILDMWVGKFRFDFLMSRNNRSLGMMEEASGVSDHIVWKNDAARKGMKSRMRTL